MSGAGVAAVARSRGSWVSPPPRIDRAVALTGLALVGCALAAAAAGALWLERPVERRGTATYRIAGRVIQVPGSWTAEAPASGARASARVDLAVPLSDLLSDPGSRAVPPFARVFVTLAPADGGMNPADRPALLHARFLSSAAVPVEGGLIRREFRAGTPFEGEALYLAPPDGRAFAARCAEGAAAAGLLGPCLAELRLGSLDLQLRLTPALLAHGEAAMRALAQRFGEAR